MWGKYSETKQTDILEWQFSTLKKRYFELVAKKSPEVIRSHGGCSGQLSFHAFAWDVLKAVHHTITANMDELVRRMAGDVKKYGLNPALIHRSKAKGKAKGKAKCKPALLPPKAAASMVVAAVGPKSKAGPAVLGSKEAAQNAGVGAVDLLALFGEETGTDEAAASSKSLPSGIVS